MVSPKINNKDIEIGKDLRYYHPHNKCMTKEVRMIIGAVASNLNMQFQKKLANQLFILFYVLFSIYF